MDATKEIAEKYATEKTKPEETTAPYGHDNDTDGTDEKKLPGVAHMEAFRAVIKPWERWVLFFGMFLVGCAYGLDLLVRSTYQAYATSAFAQHSLLSTINVIRGVIAAVVQPLVAKLSDQVGRLRLFVIITVLYVVGTIVETCAHNVQSYAAGALLYQIGYTCSLLLLEIIIADITSIKTRLFFIFIPNLPYLVNAWISGNVTAAVLGTTTWQWGIGMWCIIYPACTLPFIITMFIVGRRASKTIPKDSNRTDLGSLVDLFWKLDVIGVFLLTAVLSLVLIPLMLAGGETKKWQTAGILTPIILGVLIIPVFVWWERRAQIPIMPVYLLQNKGIWGSLGLATFMTFSYATQADYLYTVLLVAFDFDINAATRVASVYSFCAVVGGVSLSFVVMKTRRLRPFIHGGLCLWLVAYGILYYFRGGPSSSSKAGVIAGQVLLGVAGGFFPYPNMALAQSLAKHEDIAVITGLLLTVNNMGVALGGCVSGAIWTQTLYQQLAKDLSFDPTLASQVYASPLYVVPMYPVGSAERDAIIHSYRYIQRLLNITGMCLVVPMLSFSLLLPNIRLGKKMQK